MSEEKKTVELKDEELEKVSGGENDEPDHPSERGYFCPNCGFQLGSIENPLNTDGNISIGCPICRRWVTPIEK